MRVVVIVLGDLGRSPRMQYHCQSLIDCGHSVTLVGYAGEELIPSLVEVSRTPRLRVVRLRVPDLSALRRLGALYFVLRTIVLSTYLLCSLILQIPNREAVDFVMVQNPPALPLLFIAFCYCQIRAFRQGRRPGLIIDWHNLGYSMLKKGSNLQKIAETYERIMAPLADGHLTVTNAMKSFLQNELKIIDNVSILYDKPPIMFQPLNNHAKHEVLTKLHATLSKACPVSWTQNLQDHQTLFTEKLGDQVRYRPGRPTLVTNSTSWTSDEDFGILLVALEKLDSRIQESSLKIVVVVTGKGPERSLYEERISQLKLQSIAVATVWLEAADYPKLLACADLGVSLHTSTSGLDLPMKILDLFGCETPVVAHDFECLFELVQDGVNGRIFRTSDELSTCLYDLLMPLSCNISMANHSSGDLAKYSHALHDGPRWHSNWMDHAFPHFSKIVVSLEPPDFVHVIEPAPESKPISCSSQELSYPGSESGTKMAQPQPPPAILQQFRKLVSDSKALQTKITELEMDRNEHILVEETLKPLDPQRRAFRLVGECLVERTVGEVLPTVSSNRENMDKTIKALKERLEQMQTQAAEIKAKYNLQDPIR